MFGNRGSRAAEQESLVWLLGNRHPGANRSIGWDEDFGNLDDPDILVVDLTTLTADVLRRIDKDKLDRAQTSIRDKLAHGGTIVVITQPEFSTHSSRPPAGRPDGPFGGTLRDPRTYSNYHILPAVISTSKVPCGSEIRALDGHPFREYIDAVEGFGFLIGADGDKLPLGPTGAREAALHMVRGLDITDNSGHHLGFALTVLDLDGRRNPRRTYGPGRLVLLPPPTEPIGEAIGRILSVYKETAPPAEAPPAWAGRLSPGPADKYRAQIAGLEERKAKVQGEIDGLARRHDGIMAHRRLLYSDGPGLEDAVVEAFRVLGFDDIERMGSADEEDASFGMGGSGTRYSHCVIEAKGTSKGIQMQHILQCSSWARQRAKAEGSPTKGVLVPNQHRLKPYPESRDIRTKIETNQLEQAVLDDVCIIPSWSLYEAVGQILDGETPDRAGIASKIANTKGVLADVL